MKFKVIFSGLDVETEEREYISLLNVEYFASIHGYKWFDIKEVQSAFDNGITEYIMRFPDEYKSIKVVKVA